jgi:hypothetical protein
MNIKAEVALALNIGLQVCHLKVVVHPIHNKVWEPRIFAPCLEKFVEKLEAFLSKVVSKYLETHESLIL